MLDDKVAGAHDMQALVTGGPEKVGSPLTIRRHLPASAQARNLSSSGSVQTCSDRGLASTTSARSLEECQERAQVNVVKLICQAPADAFVLVEDLLRNDDLEIPVRPGLQDTVR